MALAEVNGSTIHDIITIIHRTDLPSSPEIDQQESKSSTVAHSNESIPPIPLVALN
ncbi:hypothetical protein ABEW05_003684 [Botrytis cinerea]